MRYRVVKLVSAVAGSVCMLTLAEQPLEAQAAPGPRRNWSRELTVAAGGTYLDQQLIGQINITDPVAYEAYRKDVISERHRHRYEFNNRYRDTLIEKGLRVSGVSPDNELVEIIEVPNHPWFLGCQFHPEFQSRPWDPHPLFREFIRASHDAKRR